MGYMAIREYIDSQVTFVLYENFEMAVDFVSLCSNRLCG